MKPQWQRPSILMAHLPNAFEKTTPNPTSCRARVAVFAEVDLWNRDQRHFEVFGTPTSCAGQAPASATTNPELTSTPGLPKGAGQHDQRVCPSETLGGPPATIRVSGFVSMRVQFSAK